MYKTSVFPIYILTFPPSSFEAPRCVELINTISSSVRSCFEHTWLFVFYQRAMELNACQPRKEIEFFVLLFRISKAQVSKLDRKKTFSFCLQSNARIRGFSVCAVSQTGFPFFWCVALRHWVVGTGRGRAERWLQNVGHSSLKRLTQCHRRTDKSNAVITPQIRSRSFLPLVFAISLLLIALSLNILYVIFKILADIVK